MSSSPSLTSALPATSFPSLCPPPSPSSSTSSTTFHAGLGDGGRAPVAVGDLLTAATMPDRQSTVLVDAPERNARTVPMVVTAFAVVVCFRSDDLYTRMDSRPSRATASKSLSSLCMHPSPSTLLWPLVVETVVNVVAGFVNNASAVFSTGASPGLLVVVTNAARVGGQVVLVAVVSSRRRLVIASTVTELCPIAEDLAQWLRVAGCWVDVVAGKVPC
ncbi:hypothetical protein DFP72DRAFT_1070319 [Ephemerocybe angulata]|uniref:Uncharacterized protein n=1 Tax=Ephemerocybe angulata TaxID=980116 RepID=A0A8H6M421_9AGAR|nr:hypothetical protein DFP72DRAFT_1070319 [Tulosesus angulatus]